MEQLNQFFFEHTETIYFVVFCVLLGVEVISGVPAMLHTPLMSGANAIHGVVLIGALLVTLQLDSNDYAGLIIGALAVFLGTLNVAGGFFVTGRMLEMFKPKPDKKRK